jgi:hypothetical protein
MNLPPLRSYQQAAADATHSTDRLAYLWSPRLGKSLEAIDFLLKRGVKRAIITCPLIVAPQWIDLLVKAGLTPINGFSGPCKGLPALLRGDGVLVINDDRLTSSLATLRAWKADAFVGDESHRFRGVSTGRGRAMRKLTKGIPLLRLLTGTPTPSHMGNLWGQMTAIDPVLWESSYEKFARRFLIRDSLFPSRVLGVVNETELRKMLLKSSNILRREEVFGPDTWQVIVRDVSLPTNAARLYSTIVKKWVAENELGLAETFEAAHQLKRLMRLQQLTSGFMTDETGVNQEIHTAKIDLVVQDLEDIVTSDENAVLFHRFTWEGDKYESEISRRIGCKVVRIAGDTKPVDREKGVVAVVQTQAGGIGISLAGATHALFVSQLFSFDDEQQARDRIYAPGARKCVTYYRVPNTIDSYIANVLDNKETVHTAVTRANIEELCFGVATQVKRGKA